MNIIIVGYSESNSSTNKTAIINILKAQTSWAKLIDNVYAVVTDKTAKDLRDRIVASVNEPDRLFVYTVNNRYWATSNMPADVTNWLQSNWSQS